MSTQIQLRRGLASAWTTANPVLASGEIGWESDTGKRKTGNGSGAWSSLAYDGVLASTSVVNPSGLQVITSTNVQGALAQLDAGAHDYDALVQMISDGATADTLAQAQLSARIDPVEALNPRIVVSNWHKAVAATPRTPGGANHVEMWIGTVTPTYAMNGDLYLNTSSGTMQPLTVTAALPTSGKVAEYDASTLATAVSGSLSPWPDGLGTYPAAANGAVAPTVILGPGSVSKAVQFNGSTQQLTNAALTGSQPCTLVVVGRFTNSSQVSKGLVGTVSNTSGSRQNVGVSSGGLFYASAGTAILGAAVDTAWHVLVARFSTTSSDLKVLTAGTTTTVAGNAGTENFSGIRLGANSAGGLGACELAHVLRYDRLWTDQECLDGIAYLRTKWGL